MTYLSPGSIFITRNTNEVGNDNPGYWNHCAILSSRMTIVEAQEEPGKVIEVKLDNFRDRYPHYEAYHSVYSPLMVKRVDTLIGTGYNRLNWYGLNCVGVISTCFKYASKKKVNWRIPDDVQQYFRKYALLIDRKEDYENWIKPRTWFEGRIR